MKLKRNAPIEVLGRLAFVVVVCLHGLLAVCAAPGEEPKLRPGDTVFVNVVGEELITATYEISEGGTFQMPYLDDLVLAAGKTTAALEATLLAMLKPDYLLNPQIIVTLKDKKKQSCMVLGQVVAPRMVEFDPDEGLTLQQAIGQAGDLTEAADAGRIQITRSGSKTIAAPMPQSRSMRIVDGDTINVPKVVPLGTYKLSGFVRRADTYEIPQGSQRSLMWAIGNGGGVDEKGSLRRVEVRRNGRLMVLKSQSELEAEPVMPDDLIEVGRKIF